MRNNGLIGLLLTLTCSPAFALNIVLSNDDGLTSNIKALYEALKHAGHDVIVSVPCTQQSGRGTALAMYSTDTIVADNDGKQIAADGGCRFGVASIGAPAVGPFRKEGYDKDYFYVHGTPVMATMYGLDVLALQRWKRPPDLVLSGPNEGRNAGPLSLISGTVEIGRAHV
jgi:5'-nucleotidase